MGNQEKQKKVFEKFESCIYRKDVKKIKKLVSKYGVEYFDELNISRKPVICSVIYYTGDFSLFKFLAKSGFDIHKTDTEGQNALYYAIRANRKKIMKYLIKKGIDVNNQCKLGQNAFMDAIEFADSTKKIKIIYETGIDINVKNRNEEDVVDMMEDNMTEQEIKDWIQCFLETPERCNDELLKKIKEKRLEYLFKV